MNQLGLPRMQILAVIVNNQWKPGIGDPSFIGWFTFTAYFLASACCFFYALRTRRLSSRNRYNQHSLLWWSLVIALLLLGLNKQLDLQSWLMMTGKEFARTQGWYQQRLTIHMWLITGIITAVFALFLLAARAMRNIWQKYWLVLFGVMFLATYLVTRAPSFHHVAHMLHWQREIFRMNWILELAGIVCIGVSATINLRKSLTSR
ncbi:MAG: hypothetical protein QNJ63_01005 [Calothrix sp. MO_192.B10]|nr:hypothetical protein [Calothrix sp. MO_192.B10]